jgi:2-(1,2-epoxy-1,2-dihydrophenyl)acetyl-CoA isomerase
MSFANLQVETIDGLTVIRLNDPATLNSVTAVMLEELDVAFDSAAAASRAIILSSVGRAFSSGANLSGGLPDGGAVADGDGPDVGMLLETHYNPLILKLRDLPVPWISAVRGAAAGVSCALALAADMIIASDKAYFLQAFARIGLVPDGGASWLLAKAAGRPRAMEMMMLGDRVPAAQALTWGLVNRVVPDDDLDGVALDLGRMLAKGPTRAYGLIRRLAWSAMDASFEEALDAERAAQREAGRTNDAREGVAAFTQKRPAAFVGG